MKVLKDIDELLDNKIITLDIAEKIKQYYQSKRTPPQKRLFIVFGILGAILVGLGINLIIAHNWDNFSKELKSFFAFLPLVIGQLACVFVILKKYKSTAWREAASAFLFFAIAASISLISQIYNIPGDLSSFLLTWMLLALPLIYIMNSSLVSLLFIAGVTWYSCETTYWNYPSEKSYLYWLLLLASFPHYYRTYLKSPKSNFLTFHNWLLALSLVICLGTIAKDFVQLMGLNYMGLFSILYLTGNLKYFKNQKLISNAFLIVGALGSIILLLMHSFDSFMWNIDLEKLSSYNTLISPEFVAALIFVIGAILLLLFINKNRIIKDSDPLTWSFMLFIIIYFSGYFTSYAYVFINFHILALAILIIKNGARKDHLGILNFGLIIITVLTACRFFDTNISFVIRGVMFLIVGAGFFVTNFWMLKRRKENEAIINRKE